MDSVRQTASRGGSNAALTTAPNGETGGAGSGETIKGREASEGIGLIRIEQGQNVQPI